MNNLILRLPLIGQVDGLPEHIEAFKPFQPLGDDMLIVVIHVHYRCKEGFPYFKQRLRLEFACS
jgi:hypothetical protein